MKVVKLQTPDWAVGHLVQWTNDKHTDIKKPEWLGKPRFKALGPEYVYEGDLVLDLNCAYAQTRIDGQIVSIEEKEDGFYAAISEPSDVFVIR